MTFAVRFIKEGRLGAPIHVLYLRSSKNEFAHRVVRAHPGITRPRMAFFVAAWVDTLAAARFRVRVVAEPEADLLAALPGAHFVVPCPCLPLFTIGSLQSVQVCHVTYLRALRTNVQVDSIEVLQLVNPATIVEGRGTIDLAHAIGRKTAYWLRFGIFLINIRLGFILKFSR